MNRLMLLIALVMSLAISKVSATPVPATRHLVPGNTVSQICLECTGSAARYRWYQLQTANRKEIKDINWVYAGHTLNTPLEWQREFGLAPTLGGDQNKFNTASAVSPPFKLDTRYNAQYIALWFAGLLIFVVAVMLLLVKGLWFSPGNRGPRMRQNGIASMDEAARIVPALLRERVERELPAGQPMPRLRLIRMERMNLEGIHRVRDANGVWRSQVYTGQSVLIALVRNEQTGETHEYLTDMQCANDVLYGRGTMIRRQTVSMDTAVTEPMATAAANVAEATQPSTISVPAASAVTETPLVADLNDPAVLGAIIGATGAARAFKSGNETLLMITDGNRHTIYRLTLESIDSVTLRSAQDTDSSGAGDRTQK